jgi:hypothetical protein
MNQRIANVLVLGLIVTLVLLSGQAEPVTAVAGYVYAALLSIALLFQLLRKGD